MLAWSRVHIKNKMTNKSKLLSKIEWIFYLTTTGQVNAFRNLLHPFKYRQRNESVIAAAATNCINVTASSQYHRSANLLSQDSANRNSTPSPKTQRKFRLRKALIVTKLSRYEFEQHKHPKMTVNELEHMLRDRGTDYDALIQIHKAHKEFETRVANSFEQFGVEVKLVNRWVQQLNGLIDRTKFIVLLTHVNTLSCDNATQPPCSRSILMIYGHDDVAVFGIADLESRLRIIIINCDC